MVSTRRFGRLGNELYQYAAVLAYACKHNLEWSFPRKTNDYTWNPVNMPNHYNPKWVEGREDVLINENGHQFQEINFQEEWREKQIVLNGYWQSWKYFDFCRDHVLSVFGFPYQMNKGVCAIHVRRGDYLLYPTKHPVVTMEYLRKAVSIMTVMKGIKKFIFFSDDISWCITCGLAFEFSDCEFEYSCGKTVIEDLVSMQNCEHQIVSNSTMSVWAAELNQNPGKVVIIPSEDNWFGVDNKYLQVQDIYRPEWIQIKY
jgi:hypothetical protein